DRCTRQVHCFSIFLGWLLECVCAGRYLHGNIAVTIELDSVLFTGITGEGGGLAFVYAHAPGTIMTVLKPADIFCRLGGTVTPVKFKRGLTFLTGHRRVRNSKKPNRE